MNKWKVAFWISFTIIIIILSCGFFYFFKTEVSIGFIKSNVESYKNDLRITTTIINKELKTKKQIEDEFQINGYSPFFNENGDTCSMLRTNYIFKNDTLIKIIMTK